MQTTINDRFLPILKSLNYNVNDVIKEFLLLKVHHKISEYKSKIAIYEEKYGKDFQEFENLINSRSKSESINEYNDYLAWKFAVDSLNYFEDQKSNI